MNQSLVSRIQLKMSKQIINDLNAARRAFELVLNESIKYQQSTLVKKWDNSSVKTLIEQRVKNGRQSISNLKVEDVTHSVKETLERVSMIPQSLKVYVTTSHSTIQSAQENKTAKSNGTHDGLPKGVSPEDLEVSELHQVDKELIEKLEKEYEQKLNKEAKLNDIASQHHPYTSEIEQKPVKPDVKEFKQDADVRASPPVKKFVPRRQQLNPEAKQRKVPSSRLSRMISFGSLAAGLGVGTLAEVTRRTIGLSPVTNDKAPTLDQLFLTEANAERIVNTLCKVRGAALKIGQILSIQDNTLISPALQKAFERVRQSADFMPNWQAVLVNELGPDWQDKLEYFEERPFAAASIGQVHYIRLKDGRECAMKIQYPGVAQGIESDIHNLVSILKIWNVFPEGLFIDNLVEVAKKELAWEVNYKREAECTKKFKELLAPYSGYVVPEVIDELSTNQVFTSSLIHGMPVDQCVDLEEKHRNRVAVLIMQLCLREIFEFRCMQTDPNWSNFFYDPDSEKLLLLDFGATRSYEYEFVKKYIEVIKAAADGDRNKVLEISRDMGFLTGYESEKMSNAHVDTVMILAEVFSSEKAFDFGSQNTTARVQKLVPTIVAERLCPPPEQIYSLHRKLSGVFLLCTKLKVKISCREMFLKFYNEFKEKANNLKNTRL